jgi:hypothetical protein
LTQLQYESPLSALTILERLGDRTSEGYLPFGSQPDGVVAIARNVGSMRFVLASLPTSSFYYYPLASCSGEIEARDVGSVVRIRTRANLHALLGIGVGGALAALGLVSAIREFSANSDTVAIMTRVLLAVVGGVLAYTSAVGARSQEGELAEALHSLVAA